MKRIRTLTIAISFVLCGQLIAQERNKENDRQPRGKTQQRGDKAQRSGGQRAGERRGGQGGGGNLLFKTLDADGDGTLSSKEIDNALAALMKLDKNKDGQLTSDELRSRGGKGGQGGSQSSQQRGGKGGKGGGKGDGKKRDRQPRERE